MISKQIFSLNFMFLSSLIEELCTKKENDKTGCKLNFGHECNLGHTLVHKYFPKLDNSYL